MNAKARRKAIERLTPWFVEMSAALHLSHWVIRVPLETRPDNEDEAASVERIYGRNVAKIFLSDHFLLSDPEDQRETYTHELLHCHFRAIIEARDSLEDLLGKPANSLFVQQMKMGEEWAVDAIACVLAPFLPLPPVEASREAA